MSVSIKNFGKDHWSTFAYIETRCMDYKGVPDREHMRTDPDRHPGLVGFRVAQAYEGMHKKYPTRLKGGYELFDHDDWDCVDDLEAAGLLEINGTGINPVYKLTDEGHEIIKQLRKFKSEGGNFADFVPKLGDENGK